MRPPLTIDMTSGYENFDVLNLTINIRVPIANFFDPTAPAEGSGEPAQPVVSRVSIDHQIEQIRLRMFKGIASKNDEDNLIVFRLLQALGFEYWPIDRSDP